MKCLCEEESYDLILEADIGVDPFWCNKCGCNLDIDEFPISQELKGELVKWVQIYSKSVLNSSEQIDDVRNQHNKSGMELLEKVQKELGDKYIVVYKSS